MKGFQKLKRVGCAAQNDMVDPVFIIKIKGKLARFQHPGGG